MIRKLMLLATAALSFISATAATVGYWRFEEGISGEAAQGVSSLLDSSGNENHATPFNSPAYTSAVPVVVVSQTGAANTLALHFDGVDDVVTIPHSDSLNVTSSFTVEFWMRSPGNGARQCLLVDKSHGFTDNTGWLFQSGLGTGIIFFGVGLGGGSPYSNFHGVSSQEDLFDNQWHHLAGAYDGNVVELFVDGVSQGTNAVGTYVGNTREIRIGNTRQLSRFFAGGIDELRISDAVLDNRQFLCSWPPFAIETLADGGRRVIVNGMAGWRYTLERRESLTEGDWEPVQGQSELLCDATGPFTLTDTALLPQAFYRVVAAP
jgi:hypothetical protein